MVPLASPELLRLTKFLEKYDLKSTVSQLAGLLTAPALQANTVRIEILVHLAVAHCRGKRKPGLIHDALFPEWNKPVRIAEAKRAITEYRKAMGRPEDLLELHVFWCETASGFSMEFGYAD